VAGVLLLVGFAAWAAVHQGHQISWQEVAYQVPDDANATLTFQLTRPADSAVVCTVRALNSRHADVGLQDVRIPAGSDATVQVSARVRTAERASAVAVKACVTASG
jgi:Domain of unknown function (DUF4307)